VDGATALHSAAGAGGADTARPLLDGCAAVDAVGSRWQAR
jgi:hypothetical protein